MSVQILTGDCRELLRSLPVAFADGCITDPPYGDTSLAWDKRVDGWIGEVARCLKASSSIWVFGSMRYLASLFDRMEAHDFRYGQDIVWEKQNGSGFHADRFKRVHEHAVMFYRGKWRDLYAKPQFTNDATKRTVLRTKRPPHTGHIEASHYISEDGGPRLMRSVIYARNEHGKAVHPTQKPIEIVQPLLLYSIPPGGTVIDPFAGSGTTGMAAKQNRRNAILCEIDEGYADAARQRICDDAPLLLEAP